MAKTEKQHGNTASPPPPRRKAGRNSTSTAIVMAVMVILAVLLPTSCLVVPGMLPSLVALVTDRDREKAAAITVSALNAAGVTPYIVELWKQGHNFHAAFTILRDPTSLLVMYSAAAIGWLIYFIVPPLVGGFLVTRAQSRLKTLKENQNELKRIWGPEVAGDKNETY